MSLTAVVRGVPRAAALSRQSGRPGTVGCASEERGISAFQVKVGWPRL